MAEGGGLLNRYRALKPYRGFESPSLRHHFETPQETAAFQLSSGARPSLKLQCVPVSCTCAHRKLYPRWIVWAYDVV